MNGGESAHTSHTDLSLNFRFDEILDEYTDEDLVKLIDNYDLHHHNRNTHNYNHNNNDNDNNRSDSIDDFRTSIKIVSNITNIVSPMQTEFENIFL